MKRLTTLTRILMICLGLFLSFGAAAQQGQRQSMQERHAQMLKEYKEQLNLTDEQVTKLEAIYASTGAQQQALRNQNANREEMMTKRRELMTKTQAEVRAVLTEEQAKKFDVMVAERQQRMRNGQGQRPRSNN
ncbi:Spy/CpxP family protein refolding chaperone [Pontibacter beigongshangensis]|uniref:Spy/CpxP family protein refolding chaperone n=1 Tax=Pontibacter beigongshangensis TaxID=2574733 RepID=UPI001650042D|nr:hypothetical protein [Pontibacter beigongshangensis]